MKGVRWSLPIPAWAATSIPSPSAKTYSKTWSHLQFNSQHLRHPCTLTADDCNCALAVFTRRHFSQFRFRDLSKSDVFVILLIVAYWVFLFLDI